MWTDLFVEAGEPHGREFAVDDAHVAEGDAVVAGDLDEGVALPQIGVVDERVSIVAGALAPGLGHARNQRRRAHGRRPGLAIVV